MINRNIHIRLDYKEYNLIPNAKISIYSVFLSEYAGENDMFLYGRKTVERHEVGKYIHMRIQSCKTN